MALLYKFPTSKMLSKFTEASSPTRIVEMQKAVLKATNDALTSKFIKTYQSKNISGEIVHCLQNALTYVATHRKASSVAGKSAAPSIPRQIAIKVILGPQDAVMLAKFDVSVHLKNGAVEVHSTDCAGASKVLLSVKP
jgi:hypothetical protein